VRDEVAETESLEEYEHGWSAGEKVAENVGRTGGGSSCDGVGRGVSGGETGSEQLRVANRILDLGVIGEAGAGAATVGVTRS
jgi:hypothetical protein